MPTLVTSYFAQSSVSGDTSALSTPSFTPSDGEVIVVKAATWDTATPSGLPGGGGLLYTQQSTAAPGGFKAYCTIYTAVVATSPGAMTVALAALTTSCYHSMVVERWAGAAVAASPATNAIITGSGTPPSATITTTSANSIITWANADENSSDPAGRAYLSGAIEDGIADGHAATSSVQYYAYQTAATPGVQIIGMSAPSQAWSMTGIEIQAAPVSTNNTNGAFLSFF
jgi:hypothetical protein